jgi:hypothetical protein
LDLLVDSSVGDCESTFDDEDGQNFAVLPDTDGQVRARFQVCLGDLESESFGSDEASATDGERMNEEPTVRAEVDDRHASADLLCRVELVEDRAGRIEFAGTVSEDFAQIERGVVAHRLNAKNRRPAPARSITGLTERAPPFPPFPPFPKVGCPSSSWGPDRTWPVDPEIVVRSPASSVI